MTEITLKTIAGIQVGYQAKTGIKESVRGTHRLIQSKDFDSFQRLQSGNLIVFSPERRPEPYSVHKGDILFQARGMVHFSYCIEEELENTLAAGSFYILRTKKEDMLPQYLAWWLNQSEAQAYFQAEARGAGISFISKETLSRLKVRIPPLSIQKKVVRIITLARHEQLLLERLASARLRLVKAVCMKRVNSEEFEVKSETLKVNS